MIELQIEEVDRRVFPITSIYHIHSPCNISLLFRILQTTKPNIAPPIPIKPNTIPRTASTGSLGALLDGPEAAGIEAVDAGTTAVCVTLELDLALEDGGAPDFNGGSDETLAPGAEAVMLEGADGGEGGGASSKDPSSSSPSSAPAPMFF